MVLKISGASIIYKIKVISMDYIMPLYYYKINMKDNIRTMFNIKSSV